MTVQCPERSVSEHCSGMGPHHHEIGVNPPVEHRPCEEGPCAQLPPGALPAVHAEPHRENGGQLNREKERDKERNARREKRREEKRMGEVRYVETGR
jgi:hypothetical protein